MYTDAVTGDVILYTGLDRFDNSGDATAGFWFFQNAIGENAAVTTNGGDPFFGPHSDGGIPLVSGFTVGGSVSQVKGFRWTPHGAAGGPGRRGPPPRSTASPR